MIPDMIPLDSCLDRGLYRLNSRNLGMGVFDASTKGFVGIRNKFGRDYLFTEYHWDTGAPFGTALPLEYLGDLPREISLSEGEIKEHAYQMNQPLFDWLDHKRKATA
jgi:hypothetical protein